MKTIYIFVAALFVSFTSICYADSAEVRSESGVGKLGALLSAEFRKYGCTTNFHWISIPTNEVRWIAHRDENGAYLYVEGDYTKTLLNELKKQLGNPVLQQGGDGSGRGLSFVYAKAQCGIMISCHTDPMSVKGVLKGPLTVIGIIEKLDEGANTGKKRREDLESR